MPLTGLEADHDPRFNILELNFYWFTATTNAAASVLNSEVCQSFQNHIKVRTKEQQRKRFFPSLFCWKYIQKTNRRTSNPIRCGEEEALRRIEEIQCFVISNEKSSYKGLNNKFVCSMCIQQTTTIITQRRDYSSGS